MSVWPEIALATVMVLGTGYVLWSRLREKAIGPRGVGARLIQLVALLIILPLIGILALEGKLSGDTVGALIGVAVGYTLSGIERGVPSNKERQ